MTSAIHFLVTMPRLQKDGVLHRQYVPALLPAYNKFMCGVDSLVEPMTLIGNLYGFGNVFSINSFISQSTMPTA